MSGKSDSSFAGISQYFDALRNPYRRQILYYLNDSGTANIDELARQITAQETDQSPSELTEDDYQPIRQQLHHKHLPRLADYGLIEFDPRSGDVRFHSPPHAFMVLLWISQLLERQPTVNRETW